MIDFSTRPLVETEWLAEHLSDTNLRIVDARWRGDNTSNELYNEGHIPGAVHLDWHWDLSWTNENGIRDSLLPAEQFARVMSEAGIGNDTCVVAYAEADHSGAARLWWALHYFGHEQVAVLDGGLNKWMGEGRPLSQDIPAVKNVTFVPKICPSWLATAQEVEQIVRHPDKSANLVDCRPIEQYLGEAIWTPFGSRFFPGRQHQLVLENGRIMYGGHIPGAIHWHASTTFDPTNWTNLPPETIIEQAHKKGIEPEQRVITYCGVGISASQGLFALYLAGFRDLALYDASWEEWGVNNRYPIEAEETEKS